MKTIHKKPRGRLLKSGETRQSTLPSRDSIKKLLAEATGKLGIREVARAFNVAPDDKKGLRGLMRSLQADGVLDRAGPKQFREAGRLPENAVVEVTGIDRDGEALARPVVWDGPGRPPIIFMMAEARGQAALAPGARVLARLQRIGGDKYEGRTIKRLSEKTGGIIGVFRATQTGGLPGGGLPGGGLPGRGLPGAGRIEPTDRRQKSEWIVPIGEAMGRRMARSFAPSRCPDQATARSRPESPNASAR